MPITPETGSLLRADLPLDALRSGTAATRASLPGAVSPDSVATASTAAAAPAPRPGEPAVVTFALDPPTAAELRLLKWGDPCHPVGGEELAAAAWLLRRSVAYFRQAAG